MNSRLAKDDLDVVLNSFLTLEDLQSTLRAFEDALAAQIRNRAAMVLDQTEAMLLRTDERFKGMWKARQSGPGFLWDELEKIRRDPTVVTVQREHEIELQAIKREDACRVPTDQTSRSTARGMGLV